MESVSDMAEFVRLFNTVSEQTETLSMMLKNIENMENAHVQRSLQKKYIGSTSDWLSTSNIVFNLVSFGKYLSGEKKLLSNDKTIYDTMMSHYSKKVLFGKEAIEKTDRFISSAMAVYLNSSNLVMDCIDAEKDYYVDLAESLQDESAVDEAWIEAINCTDKSLQLCVILTKANDMFDRYKASYSPFTLYDRSDPTAPQKSIVLKRDMICQQHIKYLDTDDLKGLSARSISEDAVKAIVHYVRNNYPGRSLADFLTNEIGFNLNTSDLSKTWLAVGNLRTNTFNTNFSIVNNYYYDGIKVDDASFTTQSVHYAYHSITMIWDTHETRTEGAVLYFEVA